MVYFSSHHEDNPCSLLELRRPLPTFRNDTWLRHCLLQSSPSPSHLTIAPPLRPVNIKVYSLYSSSTLHKTLGNSFCFASSIRGTRAKNPTPSQLETYYARMRAIEPVSQPLDTGVTAGASIIATNHPILKLVNSVSARPGLAC